MSVICNNGFVVKHFIGYDNTFDAIIGILERHLQCFMTLHSYVTKIFHCVSMTILRMPIIGMFLQQILLKELILRSYDIKWGFKYLLAMTLIALHAKKNAEQ